MTYTLHSLFLTAHIYIYIYTYTSSMDMTYIRLVFNAFDIYQYMECLNGIRIDLTLMGGIYGMYIQCSLMVYA